MAQGIVLTVIGIAVVLFLSAQAEQGGLLRTAGLGSGGDSVHNERISESGQETVLRRAPQETRTNEEIEREIDRLYKKLDTLSASVREHQLRQPDSPKRGLVTLARGAARSTDPKREYLVLEAAERNDGPVNISNWSLESYVTGRRVALPGGIRTLPTRRSNAHSDVFLRPGERAFLVTEETPLWVSAFHENQCTGYLSAEADFHPRLRRACPAPSAELKRFGDIPLDDDVCYDYVDSLYRCEVVREEDIEEIEDRSGICTRFLERTFNYNSCIDLHADDPLFDRVGDWRVYLGRRDELWRAEREIIRLLDAKDRVISVIEY